MQKKTPNPDKPTTSAKHKHCVMPWRAREIPNSCYRMGLKDTNIDTGASVNSIQKKTKKINSTIFSSHVVLLRLALSTTPTTDTYTQSLHYKSLWYCRNTDQAIFLVLHRGISEERFFEQKIKYIWIVQFSNHILTLANLIMKTGRLKAASKQMSFVYSRMWPWHRLMDLKALFKASINIKWRWQKSSTLTRVDRCKTE